MKHNTSLLAQARKYLRHGVVKGGALAIVPLATVKVQAAEGYYATGAHWIADWDSGGVSLDDVGAPNSIDHQLTTDKQVNLILTDVGPVTGQQWQDSTGSRENQWFRWYGNYIGTINAGDRLHFNFALDLDFTGGDVEWSIWAGQSNRPSGMPYAWQSVLDQGASDMSILVYSPSAMISEPFANTGSGAQFRVSMNIIWTNYAADDTLTISMPHGPFQAGINMIPEPNTALILSMMSMGLIGLRHKIFVTHGVIPNT